MSDVGLLHVLPNNSLTRSAKVGRSIAAACVMIVSMPAYAQSAILVEACNNIEDKAKRLACLQEATKEKVTPSMQGSASYQNLTRAFTSAQGAVASGVSFRAYQALILEPAKEMAYFKSQNSNVDPAALALLEKAMEAYKDAETLWEADIYKSQDAGIFAGGRMLLYESIGLSGIIAKYDLPTEGTLFGRKVLSKMALSKIWMTAEKSTSNAFDLLRK